MEEADTGLYSRLFANHTAAHLQRQRDAGVRQVDHVAALQHALRVRCFWCYVCMYMVVLSALLSWVGRS